MLCSSKQIIPTTSQKIFCGFFSGKPTYKKVVYQRTLNAITSAFRNTTFGHAEAIMVSKSMQDLVRTANATFSRPEFNDYFPDIFPSLAGLNGKEVEGFLKITKMLIDQKCPKDDILKFMEILSDFTQLNHSNVDFFINFYANHLNSPDFPIQPFFERSSVEHMQKLSYFFQQIPTEQTDFLAFLSNENKKQASFIKWLNFMAQKHRFIMNIDITLNTFAQWCPKAVSTPVIQFTQVQLPPPTVRTHDELLLAGPSLPLSTIQEVADSQGSIDSEIDGSQDLKGVHRKLSPPVEKITSPINDFQPIANTTKTHNNK